MKSFDLGSLTKFSPECPMKMDFNKTDCFNAALVCLDGSLETASHPEASNVLFVGLDEVRGIKSVERMKNIGINCGK